MSDLHDREVEMALLGTMLLNSKAIAEVTTIVKNTDFHVKYHRQLFNAFLVIHEAKQPLNDSVVLKRQLVEMGIEFDAGYIARIGESVPTALNAFRYAETVRELSLRRQVLDLSRDLAGKANDQTTKLEEITSYARQYVELLQMGSARNMPRPVVASMRLLVDDLNQGQSGYSLPTGFPTIDESFGMLQASELTAIGARPGGGKTTFSMQVARYNAGKNRRVLYVSLEMAELEFAKRMACLELGIDSRLLRQGNCPPPEYDAIRELTEAWEKSDFPFLLWAPPTANDADIESRARYADAAGGLDLLVVDHLQITRCANPRMDRYQQLGEITMRFKSLAKELGIPVIVQTQLKRTEARPSLSSIRESGDVEQNCDNVWFLHREGDAIELIVEKFRHGSSGSIDLEFDEGRFIGQATYAESEIA